MMRSSFRFSDRRDAVQGRSRRGMAIVVTLMLTFALGALALSAVYLASGTRIASGLSNRAADLQYAADAALQIGKSYINADPEAMPDGGYREITFDGGVLKDAAGDPIPGITVRLWAGPTGATSGQFGAFGSLFAQATDRTGGKVVRRLELAQENFARFAYWSNRESNGGGPISFGGGDVIFGPTWSNDTVRILNRGANPFAAQFRDDFGTARVVMQPDQADFWKGYTQNQRPIPLPATAALADLAGYATSGRMNFVAPSNGDETTVRMRIEFVNVDIDNDGSSTDPQDGFFRVYRLNGATPNGYLRGDADAFTGTSTGTFTRRQDLCGEWLNVNGTERFFTARAHNNAAAIRTWLNSQNPAVFTNAVLDALDFKGALVTITAADLQQILSRTGTVANNRSQCFLAGAPELNQPVGAPFGSLPTNFVAAPADGWGTWQPYTGTIDPRVTARRGAEAGFLFPLHRSVNTGARGVINVDGTVGVSGLLVGRVTLRSTGTTVILDDVRYGTNPATTGRCVDVLGILSERDVVVADNMLNNQVDALPSSASNGNRRILDDSKDLTLHAVIMSLNTSFRVQNSASGPSAGNICSGRDWGRGCLLLLGGLIQEARGPVGTSGGTGFIKQYSYDRCANLRPPPYFPTTGRYLDNRYMEVDPVSFDIATAMARLTPAP
ncbi:MAG TPA: pilus assembly PilX N-terminal domain-containing protein [Gemmatimonadaceae bacterium]|nr:pilus assembly PilX N-terminal domain-containing protein [Gemmatimonadaceae bacterium]